jgi:metallo-beta-lactamase family protein
MKLTFFGAARQVSGSMFLLTTDDDYTILIDCGIDLEKNRNAVSEGETLWTHFPFDVADIDVVLLTHAHIDHSGMLPFLIKEGYEGQILCTAPTAELTNILLRDTLSLHQNKLNKILSKQRKITRKRVQHQLNGFYSERDVVETSDRFLSLRFNQKFKVTQEVAITFIQAGHLLGAASIVVEVQENGRVKKIGFSGDIGRPGYPLLNDPSAFPEVDFLVCEATYGNRKHRQGVSPESELQQIIQSTCVDIPGRLIIPTFSVGRTQALLHTLRKMELHKQYPGLKVFSDSVMARQSSVVHEKYVHMLSKEAQDYFAENEMLFDFESLQYIEIIEQSRALANYKEPCIIISSSGMVQGGRVEHHVMKNISNPYCSIYLIGYCAEGTMGRKLLDANGSLKIKNKEVAIMAHVASTDVFSGHGDQDDLLNFVKQQDHLKLKQVFLVHGEIAAMQDFKILLQEHGFEHVTIPSKHETFEL